MILLVIDIQKGITNDSLYAFDTFVGNVTKLIGAARENGVEIIHFQHDSGPGSGFSAGDADFEIAEMFTPADNELIFVKSVNSCFSNRKFAEYLAGKDDKKLMIVGLQTEFCIDSTVKSAFDRGYQVIIPEGTNSTFDNEYMTGETSYRYYHELMWPGSFAEIATIDEALAMLK